MKRVLILGAGFGGLELATCLSETVSDLVEVTVIDKGDAFVFGFAKLNVMFGLAEPDAVRLPYDDFTKPSVRLLRETITAIDPETRTVTTDAGTHEGDILVIALGSDYDYSATPGIVEGVNEFYSVAGAEHLRTVIPQFSAGRAVIGVCGAPFKCPPAPSEAALMLHEHLTLRGVRDRCSITLLLPFRTPIPPAPQASQAILEAFAERDIRFRPQSRVRAVDAGRNVVVLEDGDEVPFDLFLGVPKQRAPDVVIASGLTVDGYVPVDPATLATASPGVYAIGDVATQGTPKAGVFAEGAARVVASAITAELRGEGDVRRHLGTGSCYIEFGAERVARVDIDFLSGPQPTGVLHAPSLEFRAEKEYFGSSRRGRWFDYPD